MAGVTSVDGDGTGGGMLGRQARTQCAAIVEMRWRMFINGLRSIHGIRDLGATGIAWMFYSVFGLGLGSGLCAAAYSIASHASWVYLPILFWAVSFLWLMFPIAIASFQEQSDLGTLLRFPLRFGSYFLLYLLSGLMEPSTFLGSVLCLGVWLGIVIARADLYFWATLCLAVFAFFNVLLVRAVFAWIDRWLAQRKTREILGALFMLLVLSMQLLNPAVWQHGHRGQGSRRRPATGDQAVDVRAVGADRDPGASLAAARAWQLIRCTRLPNSNPRLRWRRWGSWTFRSRRRQRAGAAATR